ncbi:MAG: LuxR C-terminal-related transcriptional regulator [Raoultibacter sp.]
MKRDKLSTFSNHLFLKALTNVNISLVCGFALCQLWVTLCFFAPQLFPENPAGNVYEFSLVVTVIVSILAMVRYRKTGELLKNIRINYAIALGAGIGTVIIPLAPLAGPFSILITLIAAFLTGIASSLFFVAWYQKLAESGNATDCTLSMVLYSIFMYVLTRLALLPIINPWLVVVFAGAIPLLSALFLNRSMKPVHTYTELAVPSKTASLKRFVIRFCIGIFAVSFVSEFLRNYLLESTDLLFYSSEIGLIVLILKVICACLIVTVIQAQKKNDFSFLYRASFLLIMISALFMPYTTSQDLLYAVTNCGAFLFKIIIMLVALELCQKFRVSPVLIFGATRTAWSLDLLLGSGLFSGYTIIIKTHPDFLQALSLIFVVIVVIAYIFVFTEKDSSAILAPEPSKDFDTLQKKCNALGTYFNLSKRELEIMSLMARGRNTPRITEELHISVNTVNSHIQHIYQKLDVHSRQDILDLLDKWIEK